MADIRVKALFNQKQREFKVQGAGSDRFETDFLDALNRAGHRINRSADLSSRITEVVDTAEATTVNLDEDYEDVLSDGITLNLVQMGQRPAKGAEGRINQLERIFEEGINSVRQDILADRIDADSDDDTNSNVGLGKLG